VDVPALIIAARSGYIAKSGLSPWASIVIKKVMSSERLRPLSMKIASKLQGLIFKGSDVEHALVSRFSLPLVGGGRLIPDLPKVFFMDRLEVKQLSNDSVVDEEKPKVAFFSGCGVNYLLPDIGCATLRVLERSGTSVVIPKAQSCCGIPALAVGDLKTAKAHALRNIKVFEDIDCDYIVTSCATCGHALKNVFKELLCSDGDMDSEMARRVDAFAAKVRDITEFLGPDGDLPCKDVSAAERPQLTQDGKKVTYHDPCHLRRYQGVSEAPRQLLESSGLELVGMKHPCKCCGLGGGLAFSNYELSIEIARIKAEGVRGSGADIVATACPGCIIQLKDALHHYGVDALVVHVVELL
jgi:glycolate oxidase iron-sulfur subunit